MPLNGVTVCAGGGLVMVYDCDNYILRLRNSVTINVSYDTLTSVNCLVTVRCDR